MEGHSTRTRGPNPKGRGGEGSLQTTIILKSFLQGRGNEQNVNVNETSQSRDQEAAAVKPRLLGKTEGLTSPRLGA